MDNKKDLRVTAARPRENRKSVKYLFSVQLDVDNSCGDAIQRLEEFKKWITTCFVNWNESMREYYLYHYGLLNNENDDKYFLDLKIESILKDDTITKVAPSIEENLKKKLKENGDDISEESIIPVKSDIPEEAEDKIIIRDLRNFNK